MQPKHDASVKYAFDIVFLHRFLNLQKILFPGLISLNTGLFVFLLCTSAFEQFLAYHIGLISGLFYKVLGDKDWNGLQDALLHCLILISAMVVTKSTRIYITKIMIVGWRLVLTQALHQAYFSQGRFNFYRLNVTSQCLLDNLDQRITTDASLLCQNYGEIIADLIVAPASIVFYTWAAFTRAGWIGPIGMFGIFIVSTFINRCLMSPIVRLVVAQEAQEGYFRFKHMSIKIRAESLAFQTGFNTDQEEIHANLGLNCLCRSQQAVFNAQFALNIATNGFEYLGSIASFIVIAFPIFIGGRYDHLSNPELAQIISENAFVCIYLIFQFTKLIRLAPILSNLAGMTHRVSEVLQQISQSRYDPLLITVSSVPDKDVIIEFISASIGPPLNNEQHLIKNLNLKIKTGCHLLITGPSSAGKTSLLRSIRGLWPVFPKGSMLIYRTFHPSDMFFVPQISYFCDQRSLCQQITYPFDVRYVSNTLASWIANELLQLGLDNLIERCGGLETVPHWNWYEALSPGELQRLSFVRMFYHRPKVVFLDEATASLSTELESVLYKRTLQIGATLISVGHRESLRSFHSQLLELIGDANGSWKISPL